MCLCDPSTTKVPTPSEKVCLVQSGLGVKKVTFNACALEREVHAKLLETFPKLTKAGGFELLYCESNCRTLRQLTCKWDIDQLKACMGSQSKLYIRPIQRSIILDASQADPSPEESQVTYTCETCHNDYPIAQLREHVLDCTGVVNNTATTETTDTSESQVQVVVVHLLQEVNDSVTIDPIQNYSVAVDHIQNESVAVDNIQNESVAIDPIQNESETVMDIMLSSIMFLKEKNIMELSECVRYLQANLVTGRKLDIEAEDSPLDGETNLIMVDRYNILATAFNEIRALEDLRLTLEVQFFGEVISNEVSRHPDPYL